VYVSVTAGSTCSLLNSDPLRHSCQSLQCRRESGREELSKGSGVFVITLAGYLSLTPFTVAFWTRTLVLYFPLIEDIAVTNKYILSNKKGDLLGTNCFSCLSGKIDGILFWRKCTITENSIISDRSQNFSSSHICISTANWNLSYTWLESREEKFAKCQQAALHSDTLTSVKYIKYWVAVRSIAQFIHIRRPNDRDMDW